MVSVPNAIIRHKGMLTDNTTKIELFLPELPPEHDAELIQHAKFKECGVIIMDPEMLSEVIDMISQVKGMAVLQSPAPAIEEPQEPEVPWDKNESTGFETR